MVYSFKGLVMRIVQLPIFTKLVSDLLTELEYWELQDFLAAQPEAGKVIKGCSGLRKLRWTLQREGRGKRGGVRVIYFWRQKEPSTLYFVTIYAKSAQDDLTKDQEKILVRLVREELDDE